MTAAAASSIAATQLPSAVPNTQPAATQPGLQVGQFNQFETISPRNWARLQLLQTFPAEMPMRSSVVVFAPDGKTLTMGSSDKAQLFFFDLASGKIAGSLYIQGVEDSAAPFTVLKYLPDGSLMASTAAPAMIYHIDRTGKVLSAWESIDFAVSADGQTLAIDADAGTSLVDIANNTPAVLLKNTNGLGYSFAPDNSKIAIDAVTVNDANVDIWDIKNQTIIKTLQNKYQVSYSPDGKFLAAFDNADLSLKIFSPDGAAQITTILDTHSDYLISPDGALIAYQDAKGSSVARDTTNWVSTDAALRGSLDSFSPDGRLLVTRTDDGGILVWGVPKGNG